MINVSMCAHRTNSLKAELCVSQVVAYGLINMIQ